MSKTRALIVCDNCLTKAEWETQSEIKTTAALSDILKFLDSVVDSTSSTNTELVSVIMHRLALSQSSALDKEIQLELKTCKNHETLMKESCELKFLSKTNKSEVLIKTLLGFAKLEADTSLQILTEKKLFALCTAYEAILSMKQPQHQQL